MLWIYFQGWKQHCPAGRAAKARTKDNFRRKSQARGANSRRTTATKLQERVPGRRDVCEKSRPGACPHTPPKSMSALRRKRFDGQSPMIRRPARTKEMSHHTAATAATRRIRIARQASRPRRKCFLLNSGRRKAKTQRHCEKQCDQYLPREHPALAVCNQPAAKPVEKHIVALGIPQRR